MCVCVFVCVTVCVCVTQCDSDSFCISRKRLRGLCAYVIPMLVSAGGRPGGVWLEAGPR